MKWIPSIVEDPDSTAASIREVEWEEAQSLANFILMKPAALPKGGQFVAPTMRPEAPPGKRRSGDAKGRPDWTLSNRSCHRFEVVSSQGRIRAKQFLYDWAPPAFDHPSLWRNRPRAFPLKEEICWVGKNYLKQHAASLHRARTMIELSVLNGEFTDEQLVDFCESFQPTNVQAEREIKNTSLADLCYQSRHSECPIVVPTGYWLYQRKDLKKPAIILRAEQILSAPQLKKTNPFDYVLDCAFLYGDFQSPTDADFVFTSRADKNNYVRLLTWKSASFNENLLPPLSGLPKLMQHVEAGC